MTLPLHATVFGIVSAELVVRVTATPYNCVGDEFIILVDLAGAVTINLATIATTRCRRVTIIGCNGTEATNNITINRAGGDTFNGGATSWVISSDYGCADFAPDRTDSVWRDGAESGYNTRVVAGNGTVNNTDEHITVTATGTLTLPAAPAAGRVISVFRRYVGLDYVISGNGKMINGDPTAIMNTNYIGIFMIYDGTEWCVD